MPTTDFVMLTKLLESGCVVHLAGFDGFDSGEELHYYKEQRIHLQVNAAGGRTAARSPRTSSARRRRDESSAPPPLLPPLACAGALLHDWLAEQARARTHAHPARARACPARTPSGRGSYNPLPLPCPQRGIRRLIDEGRVVLL